MTGHGLPDPGFGWDGGIPHSGRFGDVYYSRAGGLAEKRHVFLKGCGLPGAWQQAPLFTICELGFGTGLSFLAAWQLWRDHRPREGRLHYIAVEGFPLDPAALQQCLAAWSELAPLAQALAAVYPEPQPGFHRLFPGGADTGVSLTLLCGEVADQLTQLEAHVDAWFLDGFSPERNPAMWTPAVFAQVARLSHLDSKSSPASCLATYSTAGAVRRGLLEAGFAVEEAPGFGAKRGMLRGHFMGAASSKNTVAPWYAPPAGLPRGRAAIIGGGIAGTCASRALLQRGFDVTVFDRGSALGGEASGNPAAVVMPRLTAAPARDGRFYAAAWRFALAVWRALPTANDGDDFIHLCGLLQLATDADDVRRLRLIVERGALPPALLRFVDAAEASGLAGCDLARSALHFPQGGWIDPRRFCAAAARGARIRLNAPVAVLERDLEAGEWRVIGEGGEIARADAVVLANACAASRFPVSAWLPLVGRRGQITLLPETAASTKLRCVLAYGGAIAPAHGGRHYLGATFDGPKKGIDGEDLARGHRRNLDALTAIAPALLAGVEESRLMGRVAVRCTSPDHLPLTGPLPDVAAYARDYAGLRHGQHWLRYPPATYVPGVAVLAGLGSYGLVAAPLAAELLASQLAGEPWPLERDLAAALHPGRFLIRNLKREQRN